MTETTTSFTIKLRDGDDDLRTYNISEPAANISTETVVQFSSAMNQHLIGGATLESAYYEVKTRNYIYPVNQV